VRAWRRGSWHCTKEEGGNEGITANWLAKVTSTGGELEVESERLDRLAEVGGGIRGRESIGVAPMKEARSLVLERLRWMPWGLPILSNSAM
jgi:hypothetical protein